MILRTEWTNARGQYEATLCGLTLALWRVAADDFERLCSPPDVSDVPAMVDGFVEALRREAVDRESLAIYREAIGSFVAFTTLQVRVAA